MKNIVLLFTCLILLLILLPKTNIVFAIYECSSITDVNTLAPFPWSIQLQSNIPENKITSIEMSCEFGTTYHRLFFVRNGGEHLFSINNSGIITLTMPDNYNRDPERLRCIGPNTSNVNVNILGKEQPQAAEVNLCSSQIRVFDQNTPQCSISIDPAIPLPGQPFKIRINNLPTNNFNSLAYEMESSTDTLHRFTVHQDIPIGSSSYEHEPGSTYSANEEINIAVIGTRSDGKNYDYYDNPLCNGTFTINQSGIIPGDPGRPWIGGPPAFVIQPCNTENNPDSTSTSEVLRDRGDGIRTALGCLPTTPSGIINKLISFAIGIAGGIAFLLILYGALKMILSRADPKGLQESKEIITASIVGLLLIVGSVILLKIIGYDVLRIPGFGGDSTQKTPININPELQTTPIPTTIPSPTPLFYTCNLRPGQFCSSSSCNSQNSIFADGTCPAQEYCCGVYPTPEDLIAQTCINRNLCEFGGQCVGFGYVTETLNVSYCCYPGNTGPQSFVSFPYISQCTAPASPPNQ